MGLLIMNLKENDVIFKALRDDKLVEVDLKFFEDGQLKGLDFKTYREPDLDVELGAYTTWFADPSTSVMIHYQTIDDTPVECVYRKQGSVDWLDVPLHADKPFPLTSKRVRWFKLEGLEPDTIYETRLRGHDTIHRFKTMPSVSSDIKVVMLSDQANNVPAYRTDAEIGMQTIHDNDVDVIVLAGDMVHDDSSRLNAWESYWDAYFKSERNNNMMLPMIVCLGNHDGWVDSGGTYNESLLWIHNSATKDDVLFAYNFFANLNDEAYGVIDVSDYMSIIFLNTYHTQPILGTQTTWLETTLSARQGRQHVFPYFHVSPYPSWYPDTLNYIYEVRDHWTPLFTQYGVKIAGSGHEHVHVVTKKVTGTSLDANGVVYTGQGHGMGNNTRGISIAPDEWFVDYLSNDVKGFDFIEFRQNGDVHLDKVNLQGNTLHSVSL